VRISEQHANGAVITVSGWGARKVVEAWRKAQEPPVEPEPEPEPPKVVGASASTERASEDLRPIMNGSGHWTPTVFGFVPEPAGPLPEDQS
jgi:hypothetical protein